MSDVLAILACCLGSAAMIIMPCCCLTFLPFGIPVGLVLGAAGVGLGVGALDMAHRHPLRLRPLAVIGIVVGASAMIFAILIIIAITAFGVAGSLQ